MHITLPVCAQGPCRLPLSDHFENQGPLILDVGAGLRKTHFARKRRDAEAQSPGCLGYLLMLLVTLGSKIDSF